MRNKRDSSVELSWLHLKILPTDTQCKSVDHAWWTNTQKDIQARDITEAMKWSTRLRVFVKRELLIFTGLNLKNGESTCSLCLEVLQTLLFTLAFLHQEKKWWDSISQMEGTWLMVSSHQLKRFQQHHCSGILSSTKLILIQAWLTTMLLQNKLKYSSQN